MIDYNNTHFVHLGKITTVIFNKENYNDKVELDLGDYEIKKENGKWFTEIKNNNTNDLNPDQERLVNEYNELNDKIEKLNNFINSDNDIYLSLPCEHKLLMIDQLKTMTTYRDILKERMVKFENIKLE